MPRIKVLLAEDDGDDQQFFYAFLHHRTGLFLMVPVENGIELLECLATITDPGQLPEAIILDQNMPKCNGLQTLHLLKSDNRYRHIPVMIYSTYADDNLVKEGIASGAVAVLPKPFTGDGYHKMIDRFLSLVKGKPL